MPLATHCLGPLVLLVVGYLGYAERPDGGNGAVNFRGGAASG